MKNTETPGMLLGQICRLNFTRMQARMQELGINRGQPHILKLLWQEEGQTQSELAEQHHVQPATITNMLKRMEKNDWVERKSDPNDQRVSRVYLTDAGRDVRARIETVWQELEAETFSGFTAEEKILLRRFLAQIRNNLLESE